MAERSPRENRFEIDLDRSRRPGAYRDRQNLWHDDLERLYRLIERHVGILEQLEAERRHGHDPTEGVGEPHLSIAIFGPSGSGKSSLLRTLADDVQRPRQQVLPESLRGKVASLPVMDPTTWAETDQFLYAFLASALEREDKHLERQETGYPKGLSPVQLAFQEVNEYLRVIDEPEHLHEHDPLGLSLQKLERHTSGLRLKSALRGFVEELRKALGARVVLLPVDDLDMAPDHLVRSLQSYQSFLTHARLVPVFCFTDRMPEELIEVHYQRSLGDHQHPLESATARLSISQQLAVQFLARCFPVRNRIRLGPAPARVQRAKLKIRIDEDRSNLDTSRVRYQEALELLTTASFLLFGHPDQDDAHQVKAALRPSTLRRQFQVIDAMADCRLHAYRTPQFGAMVGLEPADINEISTSGDLEVFEDQEQAPSAFKKAWLARSPSWRLFEKWPHLGMDGLLKSPKAVPGVERGLKILLNRLAKLERDATWAKTFNTATWSLLNVHRDTLRELGFYLEDLYSWSPKELRSVVIENILTQERSIRRTVVDRWFNRADYRRSQVLSLLAANIFRPWLPGEEPYGDEETPIRDTIALERESSRNGRLNAFDSKLKNSEEDRQLTERQIRERLTIPAPKALLWFLNVTLSFYLPQIMARNWAQAVSAKEPIRGRMNGYGWDLQHAPINAARIADAKFEAFSFGMLFLDTKSYRERLEESLAKQTTPENGDQRETLAAKKARLRRHLLLRIWSCYGYNSGRFWACFSMWRGLGLMGQAVEIAYRTPGFTESLAALQGPLTEKERQAKNESLKDAETLLIEELSRAIRAHCLNGLAPGSLLSKGAQEDNLDDAIPEFRHWDPDIEREIERLAADCAEWLRACWADLVLPLPAGDLLITWGDCFIRRIHGEYILGSLWPRLDSSYLEDQRDPTGPSKEQFYWRAQTAARIWSDQLLQYWRACPPMLRLFLRCPFYLKSRRFEPSTDSAKAIVAMGKKRSPDLRDAWVDRLKMPQKLAAELTKVWGLERDPRGKASRDAEAQEAASNAAAADKKLEDKLRTASNRTTAILREPFKGLSDSAKAARQASLVAYAKREQELGVPGAIGDLAFDIARVPMDQFNPPDFDYHRVEYDEWRRKRKTVDSTTDDAAETEKAGET